MTSARTVNVLGIGGSLREGSQSERALHIALQGAAEVGVRVQVIAGPELVLPFYDTSLVGDIVQVRNTGGPKLQVWQNGDWSVPWSTWSAGSALH